MIKQTKPRDYFHVIDEKYLDEKVPLTTNDYLMRVQAIPA